MSQMNKESSLEGVKKMVISLCDMVMMIDTSENFLTCHQKKYSIIV